MSCSKKFAYYLSMTQSRNLDKEFSVGGIQHKFDYTEGYKFVHLTRKLWALCFQKSKKSFFSQSSPAILRERLLRG